MEKRMKSIKTESYRKMIKWIISQRLLSGFTQLELSEALSKPQSYISKIETLDRRIDIIETIDICNLLNVDVKELIDIIKDDKCKQKK
jgi:transcriptional regulator with XRE-family HTH domain